MNQENVNLTEVLKVIYANLFQELGISEMGEDVKTQVLDTLEKLAMSKFKIEILENFQDKPEVLDQIADCKNVEELNQAAEKNGFNAQALMNKCFNEAKLELAKDMAYIKGSLESLKGEIEE
ncbi:hypothetical protein HOJ01_04185 [bacterium]|jgi:hypothetical protein|nr:hypothetical protein [bacterium]MBT6293977.1 hypothetical protein [bacterium]